VNVRLTVESMLRPDAVDALYGIYAAAFEPLRFKAAARQLLTVDEFGAEMADHRIEKYVVWNDDSSPMGVGTLAIDLSAVPWISPEFYTHRFPEHAARRAVFYLGYTVVDPAHERHDIHTMIVGAMCRRLTDVRAVCGVDLFRHSPQGQVGHVLAALGEAPGSTVAEVGRQTDLERESSTDEPMATVEEQP
jgi:hypothetical protein